MIGHQEYRNYRKIVNANYKTIFIMFLWLMLMILVSNTNYLLYHSIAEIFCLIIGITISIVALNTYFINKNNYVSFLGIAYFFVAMFDLIHTLAYTNMGVFPSFDSDLPTQLWIVGRYIQSISILISFRYLSKKININYVISIYLLVSTLLLYTIFYTNLFPDCFIEGYGLTNFKIVSEYIAIGIIISAIIMLRKNKKYLGSIEYKYLFASLIINILAELMFTQYISLYGDFNMIGHILKIVSYYYIYKSIIETNLMKPYEYLNVMNKTLIEKNKKLEEVSAKYMALVENTPNGILMQDEEKILYANAEALKILNIESKEELIGRSSEEFIHTEHKLSNLDRKHDILKGNEIDSNFEYVMRDNKGITKYVELTSTIIYENGNRRILTMFKDISERKHAENQLRQSERTYRNLIELLPEGIAILHNEKYVYANKAMANILNVRSQNELIGEHKEKFLKTVSEYEEVVSEKINKVIKEKETIEYMEDKIIRPDGKILDIELFVMPFEIIGDEHILIVTKDVTEKKKSEKLEVKYNEKVYYDKIKTEFFANMSHELKTPLNVIYGSSQLLQSQSNKNNLKEENVYKHTATINQNCFRLIRLINNIIDVTKMESGFYNIKRENHNIVSIIEDITLSITDYTAQKDIELVFDTEIEEKIIAIDPDKMERVILNLLSNAIKFTNPYGKISVDIYDKVESIEISIKDTGVGIPKEKLNLIFDRFGQVDETIKRNKEGSGIGLSLAKSIVEHHEGQINVKSEFGKGSEFIITLPVIVFEEEIKEEEIIRNSNVESIHIEFSDIYA